MVEFLIIFLICLLSGQVDVAVSDAAYRLDWPCEPGQPLEDQERCWIVVYDTGRVETGP